MEDLYKLYKVNTMEKYDKFFSMFNNVKEIEVLPDHIKDTYLQDKKNLI